VQILSPIAVESGAGIVHRCLEDHIPGYSVRRYSRWWELMPFAMPFFVRGIQSDVIHTALDYACLFRRRGTALVATAHNYVLDRAMRPYSSAAQRIHYATDLRWLSRRSLLVADCVTAVSRFVADLLAQDLGTDREVRVIYNGVDVGLFRPGAALAGKDKVFRVLFCGNLSRRKRSEMIQALAARLGSGFEIYYTAGLSGRGMFRNPEALGATSNIRPLGRLRHDQMPEVYQSVDALFMPSMREGFGLCVAEAMACGLPVVVDGGSAMPELVLDGKGGFICQGDDLDCYTEAFRRLAGDRRLAREMGAFNRVRVEERFTLARMVSEYSRLFEEVLDTYERGSSRSHGA
jgi:glycosyltransferase involved in cell wall biosynthesis